MAYFNLQSILGGLGGTGTRSTSTSNAYSGLPVFKPRTATVTPQPPTGIQPMPPPPNITPPAPGGGTQIPLPPPDPFGTPNPADDPAAKQKALSDKLMEQLLSFIGDPSRYNNEIVGKQFENQRGRLQQGFDVERQRVNEDAARRGLFYSTEPTGRFGDIAGQQAKAESDLLTNLTVDQAKTHSEDMSRAISTILGFGNQQFGQQLATAQFNMLQDEGLRNFLLQLLGGTS